MRSVLLYNIKRAIGGINSKITTFQPISLFRSNYSTIENIVKPVRTIQKMPIAGSSSLLDLRVDGDIFVDQSMIIKDFLECGSKVVLKTAPRRFGKSTVLDILQRFFDINNNIGDSENNIYSSSGVITHQVKKNSSIVDISSSKTAEINRILFKGGVVINSIEEEKELDALEIDKYPKIFKLFGSKPVLYADFKDVIFVNTEEFHKSLALLIYKTIHNSHYKQILLSRSIDSSDKYLLEKYSNMETSPIENKHFFRFFSDILSKLYKKNIIVLIDEYDTPINLAYQKFGDKSSEYQEVIDCFRLMMGSLLKNNDAIYKAYITGILRLAKADLFSTVNNISEYTILDKSFSDYYGFSEPVVIKILEQAGLSDKFEEVKKWYNGYNFSGEVKYNPWSVMRFVSSGGVIDKYWVDSGDTKFFDNFILNDLSQKYLSKFVRNQSINVRIEKMINFADFVNPKTLIDLFVHAGYLNAIPIPNSLASYNVKVPNKEVQEIFLSLSHKWLLAKSHKNENYLSSTIEKLQYGKIDEFIKDFEEFILSASSFFNTGKDKIEAYYNGLIVGIFYEMRHEFNIKSDRESGHGRVDDTLISKPDSPSKTKIAIIFEHKVTANPSNLTKDAKKAIDQIQDNQYDADIKSLGYIDMIVKIGIAYHKKKIAIDYIIERKNGANWEVETLQKNHKDQQNFPDSKVAALLPIMTIDQDYLDNLPEILSDSVGTNYEIFEDTPLLAQQIIDNSLFFMS